ncbi:MAG: DEAD/DEAH box helicase [Bacteroidetes bacterium RIFOXYB12_FULL_41_6]|nr:MAG: DEAD/DEAH box helicase [Bacteroidetes bacterium RIFOXYB12_FULL_41_6]
MTFNDLNLSTPLNNALIDLGFEYPTPIQQACFSLILSGKDTVGVAQTGTGKTFAYLLPLLRLLPYSDQRAPRVLIVVPTRELVIQVEDEIRKLTTYMNVRHAGVYGGTNINTQKKLVYEGMDILVATPGRLLDLALTGVLSIKSVQKFVIDEVDEMFNLGFRPQVMSIMEILPEKRQNIMFSATLTREVETVINTFFNHPEQVVIAPHGTPLDQIVQQAYDVPNFYTKVNLIKHLLATDSSMEKVLVFTGSKRLADRLAEELTGYLDIKPGVLHSNKSQNNRFETLKKFENGKLKILITTDIMARGLDISDVSHVINFSLPTLPEDYIHRIGRTGRADKEGVAISFINKIEKESQGDIEQLMKKPIPMLPFPVEVAISTITTGEEKPAALYDKPYLVNPSRKKNTGAFHEKSAKNQQVNSGGAGRKEKKRKAAIRKRM